MSARGADGLERTCRRALRDPARAPACARPSRVGHAEPGRRAWKAAGPPPGPTNHHRRLTVEDGPPERTRCRPNDACRRPHATPPKPGLTDPLWPSTVPRRPQRQDARWSSWFQSPEGLLSALPRRSGSFDPPPGPGSRSTPYSQRPVTCSPRFSTYPKKKSCSACLCRSHGNSPDRPNRNPPVSTLARQ